MWWTENTLHEMSEECVCEMDEGRQCVIIKGKKREQKSNKSLEPFIIQEMCCKEVQRKGREKVRNTVTLFGRKKNAREEKKNKKKSRK